MGKPNNWKIINVHYASWKFLRPKKVPESWARMFESRLEFTNPILRRYPVCKRTLSRARPRVNWSSLPTHMQWWPVPLSVVSYICNLRNEWFLTCGSLFPWPLVPWLATFVECALHVNLFNLFILVLQDRLQKLPQIINAAEKVIQMVSNDGNCFRAREVRPAGSITYAKTPWLLNFCTVANLSYQLSWWLKFIFIPSHQITSFFKKPTPFVISTRVRRW